MQAVMDAQRHLWTISGVAVMPTENVAVPKTLAAAVPDPVRLPMTISTVTELLLATFFLTHHPVTITVLPKLNELGVSGGTEGFESQFRVRVVL